jgi:hypothetical protein
MHRKSVDIVDCGLKSQRDLAVDSAATLQNSPVVHIPFRTSRHSSKATGGQSKDAMLGDSTYT